MSGTTPRKYEYETIILEKHLDSFGHVNNAVYLQLLEEARWDLITKNGYGLDFVVNSGIGPTILDIQISFRRELLLRQKIRITTQMLEYATKVGTLKHEIFNEAGELCSEAIYKIGLFDTQKRKLISPTPEWIKAVTE